jgi:hypothetical protein
VEPYGTKFLIYCPIKPLATIWSDAHHFTIFVVRQTDNV